MNSLPQNSHLSLPQRQQTLAIGNPKIDKVSNWIESSVFNPYNEWEIIDLDLLSSCAEVFLFFPSFQHLNKRLCYRSFRARVCQLAYIGPSYSSCLVSKHLYHQQTPDLALDTKLNSLVVHKTTIQKRKESYAAYTHYIVGTQSLSKGGSLFRWSWHLLPKPNCL